MLTEDRLNEAERFFHRHGGKSSTTSVSLGPLSDEEASQLIANLLGQAELAEEARVRITEAAEGKTSVDTAWLREQLNMPNGWLTERPDEV